MVIVLLSPVSQRIIFAEGTAGLNLTPFRGTLPLKTRLLSHILWTPGVVNLYRHSRSTLRQHIQNLPFKNKCEAVRLFLFHVFTKQLWSIVSSFRLRSWVYLWVNERQFYFSLCSEGSCQVSEGWGAEKPEADYVRPVDLELGGVCVCFGGVSVYVCICVCRGITLMHKLQLFYG